MILYKKQGRFSEVLPEWEGGTAILIGGGPSLTDEQIAIAEDAHASGDAHVIAINDAYLLMPHADVCYAADAKWHAWHNKGIENRKLRLMAAQVAERWANFAGQKCSIETSMENIYDPAVHILKSLSHPHNGFGLSRDPCYLATGWHSGFQALNIALLAGAKTILLLGFDGKRIDGKAHWFGEHPTPSSDAIYEKMRMAFSHAEKDIRALGVRVINCSMGSAIESFEKMDISKALNEAH